jgi:hypothetical protein
MYRAYSKLSKYSCCCIGKEYSDLSPSKLPALCRMSGGSPACHAPIPDEPLNGVVAFDCAAWLADSVHQSRFAMTRAVSAHTIWFGFNPPIIHV